MRLGELLGLQWGDIDWEAKRIWVRRTLYKGEFYRPKTKQSRRAIDVGDQLLAVLSGLRRSRYAEHPAPPDDLVFVTAEETAVDPDNLRHRVWAPALAKAELRHVRIHSLRHFYASALIQSGENIKYISAQLGHASVQITLDRYGHLFPNEKRTAAARLEARLGVPDYVSSYECIMNKRRQTRANSAGRTPNENSPSAREEKKKQDHPRRRLTRPKGSERAHNPKVAGSNPAPATTCTKAASWF